MLEHQKVAALTGLVSQEKGVSYEENNYTLYYDQHLYRTISTDHLFARLSGIGDWFSRAALFIQRLGGSAMLLAVRDPQPLSFSPHLKQTCGGKPAGRVKEAG